MLGCASAESLEHSSLVRSSPKWSLSGKPAEERQVGSPGPGAYNARALRSPSPSYRFGTSTRDERPRTAPGPGQYSPVVARMGSAQTCGFGSAPRLKAGRPSSPGPGAYDCATRMGAEGPKFSSAPKRDVGGHQHLAAETMFLKQSTPVEKFKTRPDDDVEGAVDLCAICLDRPAGARVRPCGHDHFCPACVQRLSRCPLCRAPLLPENGQAQLMFQPAVPQQVVAEEEAVVESHQVITRTDRRIVKGICGGVGLFILIVGVIEHMHDLDQTSPAGDPWPGRDHAQWLTVEQGAKVCEEFSPLNAVHCDRCVTGYFKLGTQCFRYLENFPSMMIGAALGGSTYLRLILVTQCLGFFSKVLIFRRMLMRNLMPRKEFIVLVLALVIEILRVVFVDVFVLREYFGGRAYQIFREPLTCTSNNTAQAMYGLPSWQAADSRRYCNDISPHTHETRYYIASRQEAWSSDEAVCSTFTTTSALLAFDEVGFQVVPGHTRFKTLGWAIGGEFAMYCFLATFLNELADTMFVIPMTTSNGWLCKLFAIGLEILQLGALCPATVFTHSDCLHFAEPLGISLNKISTAVVSFGYLVWGAVFLPFPLAAGGVALLLGALAAAGAAALTAPVLWCCTPRCCLGQCGAACMAAADGLDSARESISKALRNVHAMMWQGLEGIVAVTTLLIFFPMIFAGIFLGTLVVMGQGSKEGAMQFLTALVLLSDVLFKIVATVVTELVEWFLHRRVKRALAERANHRSQSA